MAGGLAALLDDVALIARTAAASVDDVSAAVGKTSAKAAGVVVDDAAVTPRFVDGVKPARELPIIWRITKGSLRNKLVFILPVALLLSAVAPWALTPLLMLGGTYLCFEGAEKILGSVLGHGDGHDDGHGGSATEKQPAKSEDELVRGAITTDFILSAEIMVISLNEVAHLSFWMRTAVLIIVALAITAAVYGAVAILVKMDDMGLALAQRDSSGAKKFGMGLVKAMPVVLSIISVVGVAAMLWVGGHILLVGFDELFWSWPHDVVHHLEEAIGGNGAVHWIVNTLCSAIFGFIIGAIVVAITHVLPRRSSSH